MVEDGVQMLFVAVHVAVGEKPQEMECAALPATRFDALPHLTLEQGAGIQGPVHQTRALIEDPARAHGVVTDLGVSHVLVGGKTHRGAVSAKGAEGGVLGEEIQGGGVGGGHRIPLVSGTDAHTVHHCQQDGAGKGTAARFFQGSHHSLQTSEKRREEGLKCTRWGGWVPQDFRVCQLSG